MLRHENVAIGRSNKVLGTTHWRLKTAFQTGLRHSTMYMVMKLPLVETCVTCMQGEKLKRNAGDRLPASYINFYRGNGCAVIPAFGEATDEP